LYFVEPLLPPVSDLLKDATVNSLLQESTVLWQLGSTGVLALTDDIVAKAGFSVDVVVSRIPNLKKIRQWAPGVPLPEILDVISAGSTRICS
jgi:hypothetical protein